MRVSKADRVQQKVKNVVILGGSYAGCRAAELLATSLSPTHRVVLIDRQSHFNHLYIFPRLGVVPNEAHKAFIPYTNLFDPHSPLSHTASTSTCHSNGTNGDAEPEHPQARSIFFQSEVTSIHDGFVVLDRDLPSSLKDEFEIVVDKMGGLQMGAGRPRCDMNNGSCKLCSTSASQGAGGRKLSWDYLIYALGSNLPPPLVSPAREKKDGIAFLKTQQDLISKASSILIVGAGALGIQYATDIADLYSPAYAHLLPSSLPPKPKKITLVHSRNRFLPLYDLQVHEEILRRLKELEIDVVFGERLALPTADELLKQEREGVLRKVKTKEGHVIEYDLLLRCTGQSPNSSLLASFLPSAINPSNSYISVLSTLQLPQHPKIFAIGDVADTTAIKAGHIGWNQAEIAAKNILKSIGVGWIDKSRSTGEFWKGGGREEWEAGMTLDEYVVTPPQIRVTLGLNRGVSQLLSGESMTPEVKSYETTEVVGHWQTVWKRLGADPSDPML